MARLLPTLFLAMLATAAQAQQDVSTTTSGSTATMADLVAKGYEIKASVPNGGKFIVFMQKDKSAYACEFVSVTNARCGSIN